MKNINSLLGSKQLQSLSIRFTPTLVIQYMKYLLIIFLGLSSFSAFSQSVLEHDIPSPSVGSLLRVQAPSVDLYTGRPSIYIPLYSITFKDFSYDIQLVYNAEGNKVDLPVGNVGLGWSITGGQIYRITNGHPDEIYTISEYSDRTEIPDWNLESNLYKYYEPLINNEDFLREPDLDEFIINIGKINASFYMYKDKTGHIKTKISSQNSPYFEVKDVKIGKIPEFLFVESEWKHPYTGRVYYPKLYFETRPISITEITIVDSDGVTYIFGGDINSIDLSCQYMQDHNYSDFFDKYGEQIGNHQMAWDDFHSTLFSNASTWHIKKIILPNQDNIKFNYTKGNINIVERFDHHQVLTIDFMGQDIRSVTIPDHVTIPNYANPQYYYLIDKKYDIIYPSSLENISASNGDEINFISSKRNDLKTLGHYDDQKYFLKDNYGFLLGKIQEKCYSFKLNEIRGKTDTIKLYYTDNANQRLKLDLLLMNGEERYKFQYNPLLLPPYNQMLTDNWGYYNNKKYLQMVSSLNFEGLYNYRQPDSTFVKAEILEKITYPTGGEICFQYEPHTYSKIATQYPFEIKQERGITGGVRIKRITISDNNYLSQNIIKDYLYLNEDNTSSGILSVVPKYVTRGSGRIDYDFKHMSIHGDYSYYNKSSTQINWVDKFHIGYSRITEVLSDGSKTIYSFVNHDQVKDEPSVGAFTLGMTNDLYNKYTSRGLDRGLLKSTKYCDNTGKLLKEENFTYHLDLSDYVKTINRYALMNTLPIRVSANKIYTYYPFLKKKTVIHYMNNGNIKETEEYNYNKFRLLTQTKRHTEESNNNIYEIRTKFLSDLMEEYNNDSIPNDSPTNIYDSMKSRCMLSMPIERTIMKNGHVVNANVTTYKFSGNNIVKDKLYKLETNAPLSNYSSFKLLDSYQYVMDKRCLVNLEYINFDSYGNPISIINENGVKTVCIWGYNGQYPIAIIENAQNNCKLVPKPQIIQRTHTISLKPGSSSTNEKDYNFYTPIAGDVEFNLIGNFGYIWFASGVLDHGKLFGLIQQRTSYSGGPPWSYYISTYKDKVVLTNVPAGYHTFTICDTDSYAGKEALSGNGMLNFSYCYQDSVEIGYDDVFYENFESSSSSILSGFHSAKSHIGSYVVPLKLDPNKSYFIDYQVFKNNKWNYIMHEIEGSGYTIDEGGCPIDDIRVYPRDANITSFNYIPILGLLKSKTNGRGITESYVYDASGRLVLTRDNNTNTVNNTEYNISRSSKAIQ